jgi:hypothetical protein
MKQHLQKTGIKLAAILLLAFLFVTPEIMAQQEDRFDRYDGGEGRERGSLDNPGNPGRDPDTPLPLDGGLSLLLAAGAAYGGKKLADQRKSKRNK